MTGTGFADHFSGHAAEYAAHRPSYPDALVDFLAGQAPRTAVAWDAACGSGQLSVPLARRFGRVIALDASRDQLVHAGRHPRVRYVLGRAEAGCLRAGSVDLAIVAQAAHWLDLDAYYAEVRRVAAPGAACALVAYRLPHVEPGVDELVRAFYAGPLSAHWPDQRRHVEDGYGSLAFPFPEVEAPALEIRLTWTLAAFADYVRTWSAVRRLETAGGRAAVAEFLAGLARRWGDPGRERSVAWPLALRVGRVGTG